MKILLVSDFFPTGKDLRFSGGVEARTFFIAKYLAKKHTVHVITSRLTGSKRREKLFGFTVYRVGQESSYATGNISIFLLPKKISFFYSAVKKASDLDLDIVDGCDFIGHLISKLISFKKQIPTVFWYPDVFIGQWVKTSGIFAGFGGYILEKINLSLSPNRFIAISTQTQNKLIKNNIPQEKISVIPCGVDLNEFNSKFKKKNEKIHILTIGRLVWYKRIQDLIFAYALINKTRKKLNLTIIGRGPQRNKLDELIKNLKLSRVKILKNLKRDELINVLQNSTVFCLPSEIEGFGISVIEAAAAHVPYVVSDIPVFKEITKKGKGGLFHKLGNIKDLAKKIEMLIDDKNLYQKKIKEGALLAKQYSWAQIALETENIYKNTIKN